MLTEKKPDLSKLIIQTSGVGSAFLLKDVKCMDTAYEDKKQYIHHTSGRYCCNSQLPSGGGTVSLANPHEYLLAEDQQQHSGTIRIGFKLFRFSHRHHQDPSA